MTGSTANAFDFDPPMKSLWINISSKGFGITTWKRKCRLPSCQSAAAVTNNPPSKYCSPEHGLEFFRSKQHLAEYGTSELAALLSTVHDAAGFRRLGNSVSVPRSPTERAKLEALLHQDEEKLAPMKIAIERQQTRLGARSRFITMVKERQKRVADELRGEADQSTKGIKEICGFDIRLAMDDDEFADWCEGEEGRAVFSDGEISGREGLCMKKKCEKHKYWLRIAMEDIELEERLVNEGATVVLAEENGQRQRQDVKIETCYFCSHPVYPSKGITFVRNDAKAFRFCRSKCHKNFKMKRNPRKLKWTKPFRKAANKEMILDSTLSFAARRNIPTRYSRELIATTLKTMQRVSEIQAKRERAFYKRRMAGNAAARREADRKLVQENQHMLPEVRARLSQMEAEAGEGDEIDEVLNEAPYAISLSANPATRRKKQQTWTSDAMELEDTTLPG
ncbi:hypothetical protein ABW21_db0200240 [Orbilia brochopaga]|nr:hypothetical protein ABW21_db0200240 [Drechslerella brochopaga]